MNTNELNAQFDKLRKTHKVGGILNSQGAVGVGGTHGEIGKSSEKDQMRCFRNEREKITQTQSK